MLIDATILFIALRHYRLRTTARPRYQERPFSIETQAIREEQGLLEFSSLFYFDRNANRHKYSIKSEDWNYTERGACFRTMWISCKQSQSQSERGGWSTLYEWQRF